jgi:hypothetical protein
MRTLFSVLVLGFSALGFQSCEVYPDRTSGGYHRGGYYNGGGYYDGGYYDGGGYGPTVVVSPGYRDDDHGHRYSNGYYSAESDNVNRSAHGNRNAQVNRNAQANRNAHVNRASNSSKGDHKQQ